jgi:DNA invertase Pin-like site-specific DNA recombinase
MQMRNIRMPVKRPSRKTKSGDVFGQSRRQAKMLRAGLYARVSTTDQQTLAMQMRALREYVVRRGWTVVIQIREIGSGAVERKAREQLMDAARRREIDVVLVWRLDRWGRSVTDLLVTLQELEASECRFRLADRGAGSHNSRRSSHGRFTGHLRGVRTRDSSGTHSCRTGAGPAERQTAGPPDHGRTPRCRDPQTAPCRYRQS